MAETNLESYSHENVRVLRRKDLERLTGFSRSKIYNLLNPNSKYHDPTFPTQFVLRGGGEISGRNVVWLEVEVVNWLKEQIQKSRSI